MRNIERLYWSISQIYYKCLLGLQIGKNTKLVLRGSVKGSHNIYLGDNCFIGKDFLLATYCDDITSKPVLDIGNNVIMQRNVRITCMQKVVIEDNVLMGSVILITDNNHGINPSLSIPYMKQKSTTKPVFIGEGTWIGEQCVILPGTIIGKKCVIGAHSVVKGEIPDYCMAVGNPARIIKKWDFEKNEWCKTI